MNNITPEHSPLGKSTHYKSEYNSDLLFPIPRSSKRDEIAVPKQLPFTGVDIWNGYEISWLNPKGKPMVAVAEFIFPCESINIIESKSFKLYLNSFNNTKFESTQKVKQTLQQDLSQAVGQSIQVNLILVQDFQSNTIGTLDGINIDNLDISCDIYMTQPDLLISDDQTIISECIYSDLLKSNCLVTGQPDWGSVQISYKGPKIDHASLLQYIVSFRNHNEFHEQCVERIFMDITRKCQPEQLTVYARYTRRGGLDINPFRSNFETNLPSNKRLCRQ